ncbi:divergent protein kinase domain 1C isoform X1 [Lepeophtheirus salmonis]|nr:divergent protein kinase domain 1C-like isoform X1 [Lepeophtheirus salmonis]
MFRRIQKKTFLLGCGFLIIFFLYFVRKWMNAQCSESAIRSKIQSLCEKYEKGEGGGDSCSHFCGERPIISFDECFYLHQGKEIVFSAKHGILREKVIVKSLRMELNDENTFKSTYRLEEYPTFSEYESMIRTFIRDNYNLQIQSLEEIWNDSDGVNSSLTPHQMEIVWSLVNDNEYVLVKFFSSHGIFPELMGTCGSFFIVEKLNPIPYPSVFPQKIKFDDFVDRIKIASSLLEALDKLSKVHSEPLYLCDVKKEHFGISFMTGGVKFLDLDSVFTKTILDRSIGDGSDCVKDKDCRFFDCTGKCGHHKKCVTGVVNNNFNIVCDKIFRDYNFAFRGLLTKSKHSSKKIKRILNHCHYSNESLVLPQLQKAFYEVLTFSMKKYEL